MSILKKVALFFFSCMIMVSFAACEKKGPAERAGEKVDKAVEETGEKIKESTEKAGDKIEEAGEKVKESTKK